jgi:hypothetical protein
MASLGAQICFNHPIREAVARCPECGRSYCRECITDHEGRIICAACLQRLTAAETTNDTGRRRVLQFLLLPVRMLVGLSIAWLCFYTIGRLLLAMPSEFHSGAVWDRAGELSESE